MALDFEALRAKSQETRIDFLRNELALGTTFVQSAMLAQEAGHTDHFDQARGRAIQAAKSIRRFINEVEYSPIRTELESQLEEFDRLVATL